MPVGDRLKTLRTRHNISIRQVERASRRIAEVTRNARFRVSNAWLTQLEKGVSEPGICKLFSLSVIYHINFTELIRLYDIHLETTPKFESVANPEATRLLATNDAEQPAREVPVKTTLMSTQQMAREELNQGSFSLGQIGLSDFTMYPLIRPGALVRIDTHERKVMLLHHNEYARPIYFVELRDDYACGWCELQGNDLLIIPHPASPARVRRYTYLKDAEIVGRVVSFDTPCVDREVSEATAKSRRTYPR